MGYLVEGVNSLSTERPQAHRFSSDGLSSRGVVHNRFNYATQKGMFSAKSSAVAPGSITPSRTMHPAPKTLSYRTQRCIIWPGMIIRC